VLGKDLQQKGGSAEDIGLGKSPGTGLISLILLGKVNVELVRVRLLFF
jgi:hypothetical protein